MKNIFKGITLLKHCNVLQFKKYVKDALKIDFIVCIIKSN